MKTWGRRFLLGMGLLLILAVSLLAAHALGSSATSAVRDLSRSLIPLAAGVIIGAVGVFLGSLGGLYALIAAKEQEDRVDLKESVAGVRASAGEIRDNVLLVLLAAILVEVIHAFRSMDISALQWPFTASWLARDRVLDAFILTMTIVAFAAVIDVVIAMFRVHEQYDALHSQRTVKGKIGS